MEALAADDITDPVFFNHVEWMSPAFETEPSSIQVFRDIQPWKPTHQHAFPFEFSTLPPGVAGILNTWRRRFPDGSTLLRGFLSDLAVETNHIENTFLITRGVYLSCSYRLSSLHVYSLHKISLGRELLTAPSLHIPLVGFKMHP
jgi:hypothetical protein